ncbi:MAG: ABC transporter substrate-binding protein [Clostridiales bacterium]|jgi:branched-chain amino acid transport system substrate-binding protein|nr:ABC transporter substrate-binding protein [Clostridiales bacterium]
MFFNRVYTKVLKYILFFTYLSFAIIFVSSCKKVENSEINIGILVPLSGSAAQYGNAIYNGASLCIDELNDVGGINKKHVKLIKYDEENDPLKAKVGYEFLEEQGVLGIIGDVTTATTASIIPLSKDDNMPIITPTASSEDVTYDFKNKILNENVFRTCFLNSFQGRKIAEFAKTQFQTETAALLYCLDSDYSIELKEAFENECNKLKIKIVSIEGFVDKKVDFKSQLENIKTKNPDVLFIPYYYETVSLIAEQAKNIGIDCVKLGTDGWCSVTSKISEPNLLDGSYYFSGFSNDDSSESAQNFLTKYRKNFNEEPNMFAAQSYDAAKILTESLKVTLDYGYVSGSDEFKKEVIKNIKETRFECATGEIIFDIYNNPEKQAIIIKILDGKEVFWGKY